MAQIADRGRIDEPLGFHKKVYSGMGDRNADESRSQMLQHISEAGALLNSRSDASGSGLSRPAEVVSSDSNGVDGPRLISSRSWLDSIHTG